MSDAIERLAAVLSLCAAEPDGPEWVYEEWPLNEWATAPESERDAFRQLARKVMRAADLIAVDPTLVERVREAEVEIDAYKRREGLMAGGTGAPDPALQSRLDAETLAHLNISRAVLAQLGGGR